MELIEAHAELVDLRTRIDDDSGDWGASQASLDNLKDFLLRMADSLSDWQAKGQWISSLADPEQPTDQHGFAGRPATSATATAVIPSIDSSSMRFISLTSQLYEVLNSTKAPVSKEQVTTISAHLETIRQHML